MAKKPSAKKPKPTQRPYAVYLIKQTPHGETLTPAQHRADIVRIHQYILKHGGTCALFANRKKKPDEFVSIVRGLSPARQRELVDVIKLSGDVSALMMHMLKGP